MGFHLRDIIGVGPMRFYVYIAGVSITVAFPALRFGLGPRGNIVHLVRNGLSYRFTPPPPVKTDSSDETSSVKSSSQELLHELSSKHAKSRLWPVFAGSNAQLPSSAWKKLPTSKPISKPSPSASATKPSTSSRTASWSTTKTKSPQSPTKISLSRSAPNPSLKLIPAP